MKEKNSYVCWLGLSVPGIEKCSHGLPLKIWFLFGSQSSYLPGIRTNLLFVYGLDVRLHSPKDQAMKMPWHWLPFYACFSICQGTTPAARILGDGFNSDEESQWVHKEKGQNQWAGRLSQFPQGFGISCKETDFVTFGMFMNVRRAFCAFFMAG